ncbi:hypothetical protein D3C80_854990 [compost metagenome]
MAYDVEHGVWRNADDKVEIAIRTAVYPRAALALQANAFAVAYAGRDLHIKGFGDFLLHHAKGVIDRQAIADGAGLLGQRFFQEDGHFHFNILPAHGSALALTLAARMFAEHGGKDVGKVFGIICIRMSMLGLAAEVRVITMLTQLIIFSTALVVFQHLVGFGHFFKLCLGIFFCADIRMILSRQPTIGGFYRLDVI